MASYAPLTARQLQVAKLIYGMALGRGLSPTHAREVVAAAYAESGLNPSAVNKRSGAAGLFQLLSPNYRQSAQQGGGLFNPRANTNAILGDYASFFQQHPGATPGTAGAAVERSGQGAGFYSAPLALFAGLSGAPTGAGSVTQGAAEPPSIPNQLGPSPALTAALLASLRRTAEGQRLDLSGLPRRQLETAPTPAAVSRNAGQRTHSSKTPIAYTKIIGDPYQGTHGIEFNTRGGSNNWQSENALDLAAPVGTPVYAAFGGVIGPNIGSQGQGGRFAGLRVQIDGGDNAAWYGHLSRLVVKAGQRVKAGQLLGYSGSANGVSHLHFAVRSGDPRTYVG